MQENHRFHRIHTVPGFQSRNALRTQHDVLSVVLLLLCVGDCRVEVLRRGGQWQLMIAKALEY